MIVKFTPSARTQLLRSLAYIRKDNPLAAQRFRKRAERVLKRLERFPYLGGRLREFPDLPHREVIVAPHRFFYRVEGEIVWVIAVWHGAQIPERPRGRRTR